jgi:hypothetical protein
MLFRIKIIAHKSKEASVRSNIDVAHGQVRFCIIATKLRVMKVENSM